MSDTMTMQVITPERKVLENVPIRALVVPALDGYLGVLPGHAPLVSALNIGMVKYKREDSDRYTKMAISGGFLEVSQNRVIVLADAAEEADSIDVARARQARDRARQRLRERSALVDRARAELALRRALNRLQVAEENRD